MFWKKFFNTAKESKPIPSKPQYGLPEGELVYAVGDIHGRADLLLRLLDLIHEDMANRSFERASLIFLGDYIDRGFHSREVLEALITLKTSPPAGIDTVICLAGNHEDMLLHFLDDPAEGQFWLGVGGLATLASYGVILEEESNFDALFDASNALAHALPESHRTFLSSLDEHWQCGDVLFVHAGLRPDVPLAQQRRRDKLGIRREFTENNYDFGLKVVHGHTGVREPSSEDGRVSVDTGAFATGILTAAVLEKETVKFLQT